MLPSGPRLLPVSALHPARPGVRAVAMRRRPRAESSGLVAAVACVAAALMLYVVGSMVWEFDDDGGGLLSAVRVAPPIATIE